MFDKDTTPFLDLLEDGIKRGGFETDDVLGAMIPLMKEVLATHELGLVAPLDGLRDVAVSRNSPIGSEMADKGDCLVFDAKKVVPPHRNLAMIARMQQPLSHSLDVVVEVRLTTDVDQGSSSIDDMRVEHGNGDVAKPVYLLDYRCWEHAIGHHDELTDIFALGMLLASLALGLNFTDPSDLALFSGSRGNLFAINKRLNPVVGTVIIQSTELNRHNRSQDLRAIITRLEHYRDQAAELDFGQIGGYAESGAAGKRRIILTHLRDRLFEISRRNRLIYFKPSLQSLNLTVASVPLVLDYRNIRLEQLFIWRGEVASALSTNTAIALGKYLRFEDAPYIPGVLDKIISEARRNRAEFGFAQLRLVICFLRWHNFKESPDERIVSPLLPLPVELSRKKSIRDNYVLEPTTTEAEVNPALRHHLKELYNLNLPESIDLRETTLVQFHSELKAWIESSEPAVTLNLVDRPQIALIHEKARQRVDQYRRRMKVSRPKRNTVTPEFSYSRDDLRPLGLQLFLQRIRPSRLPLGRAVGVAPEARTPFVVEPTPTEADSVVEVERRTRYAREGVRIRTPGTSI